MILPDLQFIIFIKNKDMFFVVFVYLSVFKGT